MKTATLVAALVLCALTLPAADDEWHVLTELWKEYDKAVSEDKPATQMKLLSEIKSQASAARLVWDFYDAGVKYVSAGVSINWKLRDSLKSAWSSEVEAFDEPIVSFEAASSLQGMKEIAEAAAERLKASRNEAFYHESSRLSSQMGGALAPYISSDYEYALWNLLFRSPSYGHDPLEALVAGSYPNGAWLDYYDASRTAVVDGDYSGRKAALQKVCEQYSSLGVSYYAMQDLLCIKKDSLDKAGAGQEAYKMLLGECEAFLRRQSDLAGAEAAIAAGAVRVKSLKAELTAQELALEADDKVVKVIFRNIPFADVTICVSDNEDALHTFRVENTAGSFYVQDTISAALPLLNDGSYDIKAAYASVSSELRLQMYSLSLATRLNSNGRGLYVTDYQSGKPLSSVTLRLEKGGKELVSTDLALGDGFTPLPEVISSKISGKGNFYLYACYHDGERLLKSDGLGISGSAKALVSSSSSTISQACLFMDRAAYNSGDSVFVKGVFYSLPAVLPKGRQVVLNLRDSEGNVVETQDHLTDEFGSVAGAFRIPEGLRGGKFSITASYDGGTASKSFTVDEFVLPSFGLDFNPITEFYLPGDTVPLSGRIYSYSGHSLGSASVSYKIVSAGLQTEGGMLTADYDGNFMIPIVSDPSKTQQSFIVTVSVSDGTGETQEFTKFVGISSSVSVQLAFENVAEGEASLGQECHWDGGVSIIAENLGRFTASVRNRSGQTVPAEVSWVLLSSLGDAVGLGCARSGETFEIDFSGLRSGLYRLEAGVALKGRGDEPVEASKAVNILLIRPSDTALNAHIEHVLLPGPEETDSQVGLRLGTGTGDLWAVAELYGDDSILLASKTVHLPGDWGTAGSSHFGHSLTDLQFEYKEEYPDAVRLQLFYFRRGEAKNFSKVYRRVSHDLDLPLEFTSFEDRTLPSSRYSFRIKTRPGVQCLAAIFDKASERMASNIWQGVRLTQPSVPAVAVSSACGYVGSFGDAMPILYTARSAALAAADDEEDVLIRSDFTSTLCFEPFLLSDEEGNISLSFSTSDKLSTYYVSLFAHDKSMRNAALRREMVVSIPVKVAVAEPQYLYAGDKWSLSATVSSTLSEPVSGTLSLIRGDLPAQVASVMVPAGGSQALSFEVAVPNEAGVMELKLIFRDSLGLYSDGLAFSLPVLATIQSLSETHSAVLLAGDDKQSLIQELRESFINDSGTPALIHELSVLDLVREAIPTKAEPASDNVLSLTEALYVRAAARRLGVGPSPELSDAELLSRIQSCQGIDGGFAWFEGLGSSPVVTAVVLEHLGKLLLLGDFTSHQDSSLEEGLPEASVSAAVKYLDDCILKGNLPSWCGGITLAQYLYVRSLWPSMPFEGSADFTDAACAYLVPSGKRGLDGEIFAKTRRLATLRALVSSSDGLTLAKSWGIKSSKKLTKSLQADIASLLEYSVNHAHGGIYYPNLILRRGLLESEAYAHSMLSDLLADYAPDTADGIRLWLMLQKETQHWDSDPAFVDAISSILSASEDVLSTSILSLSKTFEKPFSDILASGNGLSVTREFRREVVSESGSISLEPLKAGDKLHVGDKITAVYTIHSEENRSFVRLNAPREAALRPVEQLSGSYGWGTRPLKISNSRLTAGAFSQGGGASYSFSPHAYREVKASGSEYYFDVLPEEVSVIAEEFFVTQEGIFSAPVVSLECLYAPEYTANSSYSGLLTVGE